MGLYITSKTKRPPLSSPSGTGESEVLGLIPTGVVLIRTSVSSIKTGSWSRPPWLSSAEAVGLRSSTSFLALSTLLFSTVTLHSTRDTW